MRSMVAVILTAALLQTVANTKTELLRKRGSQGEATYYGHVKATDSRIFVTCQGGELTIRPGTVEPASRECSDPRVGPMAGMIRRLDANVRRLVVTDGNGNELTFTLSPEELRNAAQRANVGRNVTISGSANGRVINIQ